MDLSRLVADLRAEAGPTGVGSRVKGERVARQLLDEKAGRFDLADAAALAHAVQTSSWQGVETHARFRPAFAGGAWSGLIKDLDRFNAYTERVWRGAESEALDGLDSVYRDRSTLPHAGPSYPSLLMYLRNPEKYLVAMSRLTTGLEKITGISYPLNSVEQYLAYCSSAHHLRVRYSLAAQEVDLLLWGATEPSFSSSYSSAAAVAPVTDKVLPADAAPSGDISEIEAWLRENEARAAVLPDDYLASRAAVAPSEPVVRVGIARSYVRDAYVSAYAKRLAGGRCDLCNEDAPFASKDGSPYLEAHHVEWLSRGGADAVSNVAALCPNCHRKMHIRDIKADREQLSALLAGRGA